MYILGFKEVDRHAKYLGLPAIIGRSKKEISSCLMDREWKKLQGWKEKFLSRAGKGAYQIYNPSYYDLYDSFFRLPSALIEEIHVMFAKFW